MISAGVSATSRRIQNVKRFVSRIAGEFDRRDYSTHAAALAYFFLLALFPLLIFLASLLSYAPIANLFDEVVELMSAVVPRDAMMLIRAVLRDVLRTNVGLLSVGMAGALIAASSGFSALIGALNLAYHVAEGRPYWKKRLVALGLTILVGILTLAALVALVLGPQFGSWVTRWLGVNPIFASLWPYLRWTAAVGFAVISVELVYFLAPNVKQRFRAQVPGAIVAVVALITSSYGLSWYLRHLANMAKTYGTLGAVIALMLWLYVSALAILIGAGLNSALARSEGQQLPEKEPPAERAA